MSKAEKCVIAIIEDLIGRAGLGNCLEDIDDDIIDEIKETWATIIKKVYGC